MCGLVEIPAEGLRLYVTNPPHGIVAVSEHHLPVLCMSRDDVKPVEVITVHVLSRVNNGDISRLCAHRLEEVAVIILLSLEWIRTTQQLHGITLIQVIVYAHRVEFIGSQ